MADPDTPEPTGPFFSNIGPETGYLLARHSAVMGVLAGPHGSSERIGIAWLAGEILRGNDAVQVWRLEVRKVALEGRWVVKDREFVRLGEAADRL